MRRALESWRCGARWRPFLLVGFLVAGVLSVCISAEWVERHLGRRGLSSVWKAAMLGVPLPLCSCGVIPVAASMRRHGASRAAVTAFLLSTPQTGVDSIAATYALLGPVFAAFRPIAALISGLLGGVLVLLLGESKQERRRTRSPRPPAPKPVATAIVPGRRCCGPELRPGDAAPRRWRCPAAGRRHRRRHGARWCRKNQLHAYLGGGILSILLLMAAGVPIYVCATASVPIAAGFIHMGASPGAALAFLIAGSATNPATFTTVWKVLGRRTALLYLLTVAAKRRRLRAALGPGFRLACIPPLRSWTPHAHEMTHGGWLSTFWAVALLAVLAFSYFSAWRDRPAGHPSTTSINTTNENPAAAAAVLPEPHCRAQSMTTRPATEHRLGRLRGLGNARFPRLRHPPRQHLQRLPRARRTDGADRHGEGPVRRAAPGRASRGAVRRRRRSPTSSAIMPSRTIPGRCRG